MSIFRSSADDYDKLSKRISDLESRLNTFESRLAAQEIENNTMRNKVLRKIQLAREEDEPEKTDRPIRFTPFG